MSTLEATLDLYPVFFNWPMEGVSPDSDNIRSIFEEILDERRRPVSFAWRDILRDEVAEIVQDCAGRGWDGYDAEPLSPESVVSTGRLIELLPEGVKIPSVVPEPTGDIVLEWRTGDQKYFTMSISGQILTYAGVFGGLSKYGEERIFRALPGEVLGFLASYFPEV